MMEGMQERYQKCLTKISKLRQTCDQSFDVMAVSKRQPLDKIQWFLSQGWAYFGENYAQELKEKRLQLVNSSARFAFIGKIQSNKIKILCQFADEIQTLCQQHHALLLEERMLRLKRQMPVYLSVNAGNEANKDGLQLDQVLKFSRWLVEHCPHLPLQGIMAIPPKLETLEKHTDGIPVLYHHLRMLADDVGLKKLSLGMSADLEYAAQAGSNCLRIGQDLFGPRTPA